MQNGGNRKGSPYENNSENSANFADFGSNLNFLLYLCLKET